MLRSLSNQEARRVYVPDTSRIWQTKISSKRLIWRHFSCSAHRKLHDFDNSSDILNYIQKYTTDNPVSIFVSSTNNPYHNLAIENHILKHSEPNSSILFTYVNRPCIVFGRNQNPWLEINIARSQQGLLWNAADWCEYRTVFASEEGEITSASDGKAVALDLVRRRSGGGTVIHDVGNLNFSFIVPNDKDFTRNRYARVIVKALQSYASGSKGSSPHYGANDIYVNERHDIAMNWKDQAFKVSGSAFKLTKGRALHHGTLLLASPNILSRPMASYKSGQSTFSQMLSSPAKPFLDAKGVGSVSSPVHNLFNLDHLTSGNSSAARRRLVKDVKSAIVDAYTSANDLDETLNIVTVGDEVVVGDSMVNEINKDVQEMMTDAWRYGQTPSFLYEFSQGDVTIAFQAKQSKISDAYLKRTGTSEVQDASFSSLNGKLLHEIYQWQSYISPATSGRQELLEHLSKVFPSVQPVATQKRYTTTGSEIAHERFIEPNMAEQSPDDLIVIRHVPGQSTVEAEERGSNTIVQK